MLRNAKVKTYIDERLVDLKKKSIAEQDDKKAAYSGRVHS